MERENGEIVSKHWHRHIQDPKAVWTHTTRQLLGELMFEMCLCFWKHRHADVMGEPSWEGFERKVHTISFLKAHRKQPHPVPCCPILVAQCGKLIEEHILEDWKQLVAQVQGTPRPQGSVLSCSLGELSGGAWDPDTQRSSVPTCPGVCWNSLSQWSPFEGTFGFLRILSREEELFQSALIPSYSHWLTEKQHIQERVRVSSVFALYKGCFVREDNQAQGGEESTHFCMCNHSGNNI